jgi:phosphoribosylaminoimidazolecarboxamide formyltransferase/IMP cyclohydrolase
MARRALISVSDKTGIVDFARDLVDMKFEIISTGGTYNKLREAGIPVLNISEVTEFPECLDGRVKTLHPKIHAGILAIRDNPEHMRLIEELNIQTIDIVVINLYPFKETISKENVNLEEAIENIDIGGPTMLRAAAKNYQDVVVVVNPSDYEVVLSELKSTGSVSKEIKFKLGYKVFEHTAHYDALIAGYLRNKAGIDEFPEKITITFEKAQEMRYGENPHQKAVFYKEPIKTKGMIPDVEQLHGKEMSFNNINDANTAIEIIKCFSEPAAVAIKHANPCGVGVAENIYEAYKKAYEADKVSIFGGVIATNREINDLTANEINKIFVEIIIAPSFTPRAIEILTEKKNIRILKLSDIVCEIPKETLDFKKVAGGLLLQEYDNFISNEDNMKFVTDKRPSEEELKDLIFAMKVVKHTKSNAIVLAKNNMTVGVGPGQMNRIGALKIAVECAGEKSNNSVMASDAFFPFSDCVEEAYKAGIKAIIQPGGSMKDQESIDACNRYGIAMVFTGIRHFKH